MTDRLFPRSDSSDSGSSTSSIQSVDTISDVLNLQGVGTKITSVSVLDENTIYLYHMTATSGDFQDTVHGGYWNAIASSSNDSGDQLSFEITTRDTQLLSSIPNNIVINRVTLHVLTPYANGVKIEIGDNHAPARLMLFTENRPTRIGKYATSPDISYKNILGQDYKLKVTFLNSTVQQGTSILTVEYSKIRSAT